MLILGEVITLVGNLVLILNHAVAFGFSTDSSVDVEFFVRVSVSRMLRLIYDLTVPFQPLFLN